MKYVLPLLAMFLWSCSPNNNNSQNSPQPETEFAATSTIVEFGTLKPTDSAKLLSATINNNTGSTIAGPATISSSDFAFVAGANCPNGTKPAATCPAIKVMFNPSGKAPGEYNASLNLGSISVPLHATVETPAAPVVSISSSLGTNVEFGSFISTTNSTVTKTFVITNTGSAAMVGVVTVSGSSFVKSYDLCNGSNIVKGGTCQIKVSFNPFNKAAGDFDETLNINGTSISLSATVSTPEIISQSGQPAVIGGVTYASDVKFFNGTAAITEYSYPLNVNLLTLNVKNVGNLASTSSSPVLSDNTNFSLLLNNCNNVSLAANGSCQLKVSFVAALTGAYSSTLTFAGKVLEISAVKGGCNPGFHIEGNSCVADVITFSPNYSGYGSCSAVACDGAGLQSRNLISCQKLLNNNPVSGGTLADCAVYDTVGYLQQTCPSPAGNKTVDILNGTQIKQCAAGSTVQNLVSTNCDSGFHNENNACVADVITYTASYSSFGACSALNTCDGAGTKNRTITACQKLVNGSPVSGGQISDCSAYSTPSNLQESCQSPAGNKILEILHGQQTVYCEMGSSSQSIVSTDCDPEFHESNNACVADVITYTASYSSFSACSAANACDGPGVQNRTITACQKYRNGITESGGQVADCSAYSTPSNLQQTCSSPEGNKIIEILNGDQTVFCPSGSTVQTIVSTICDSNYHESNNACVLNSIALGTNASLVKSTNYTLNISSCGGATKVLVKLDNSAPNVSQGLIDCAATIPVTLSSAQGLQNVYVWGYDGTNFSNYITKAITLDSIAPTVSLTTPLEGSYQKATVILTGVCETGLPVNISGTGVTAPINGTCTASAFSQSVTLSSGEGSKNITLSQTDAAGNTSLVISRNIIKDSLAPLLTQTAYASPVTINGNTLTLSGACENSLTIAITGTDTSSVSCNAGLWTYTTAPQATDASRRYNFTQTDLAGNATLVVVDWIRDNTPPIGFTATVNSPTLTNIASGSFLVNCGPEATAYQISAAQPGGNTGSWVNCSQNSFNVPVSLNSGSNNVQFWFKDAVNNVSTTSAGGTILVDTDIPTDNSVSILTANPTNNVNASFSVLCDATANGYKVANTKPSTTDSGWVNCTQTTFNYTLTEGVNDIRFWFKDEAGNVTLDSLNSSVTLNTSGPQGMAVQLVSTTPTNNSSAQFSLTCGTAARYKIQDAMPLGTDAGWTSCTAGVISRTLSTQGTTNYKFWFKDAVDTVAASAIQIPVVYDTTPPVTATTVLSSSTPTANPVATFNLTCGDAASYQWSSSKPLASSSSWLNCSSGSISYNLTNGTNNLSMWYKDLAGNISSTAQTFTVVLNMGGPANYNVVLNSNAITNQATASFTLTCGTATHYKIIAAKPAAGDSGWSTCANGDISPSLIAGTNNFNFWFKDNVSVVTASSLDFTVLRDNTPPVLTQVLVDNNSPKTISGLVSIQTIATDAYEMYITQSASCASGGTWETYVNPRNNLVLTSANDTNTVYVKVRDQAGNESSCLSDAIYFGVDSPMITLLSGSPTKSHTAQIRIDDCLSAPQILLNEDPFALATDSGWSSCVNNTIINYNLSADDGIKTVAAWGKAGTVVSLIGNQVSVNVDTISPPAPEVQLASPTPYGDGYINSQNLSLSITNCPAGVDKVLVTESSAIPEDSSSGWQSCSLSNVNFLLSSSGSKKMYVWGMDLAKNISDLPGILDVKVAGSAAALAKVSGDNQAVARNAVSDPMVVKVVDENGFPVQGAVVDYTSSKGTLASATRTSGADGIVSNTVTVGNTLESFVVNLSLGSITQGFNMRVVDLAFNNVTISSSSMLEYMERTQNLNLNSEGVAPVVENGWQNRWVTTETSIMNPNNSLTVSASVTPTTVTPIYSILQPSFLNSLSFSGGNTSFSRSQISSSGSLQVKATSSVDPNNFKLSNVLNVKKSRQQIVSNIGFQQIITPSILGRAGNYVVFSSLNELGTRKLYSYDLTTKNVTQLPDTRATGDIVPANGRGVTLSNGWLYYAGYNSNTASNLIKLYRTNGESVVQVSNIKGDSATDNVNTTMLIPLNNKLIFYAYNAAGTLSKFYSLDVNNTITQISNTNPSGSDLGSSITQESAVINNGFLYVSLLNASGYNKLYRTDGSSVTALTNFNGASAHDYLSPTVESTVIDNGVLYIVGGSPSKLYKIVLSSLTASQISNFNGSGVADMYQSILRGMNGYLYMTTQDISGYPHFSSYHIASNTFTQLSSGGQYQQVSYFSLSNYPGYPGQYCDGKLYIQMYSYGGIPSALKLYEVDGNILTQVTNTRNDQSLSDGITYLTCFNNELFFGANNPYIVARNKLYKYADGEISQVANISNNNNSSDFITNLFIHSNNLYVIARGTATNREPQLHRYNTSSKTLQRLNISEPAYSIVALSAVNNYKDSENLVLTINSSRKLINYSIATNTSAPIQDVKNTRTTDTPGLNASKQPLVFNNEMYFSATNSGGAEKLFKTNGSTITQVSNTSLSYVTADNIQQLMACNNSLFFTATNGDGYTKLYKSNGTLSSTQQIANYYPTSNDSYWNMVCMNNRLYFNTSLDNFSTTSLYIKTDGETFTTLNQIDLAYRAGSYNAWAIFNNKIYFIATTAISGGTAKLYEIDPDANTVKLNVSANTQGLTFYGNNSSTITNLCTTQGTCNPFTVFNGNLLVQGRNTSLQQKMYYINSAGNIALVYDSRGAANSDLNNAGASVLKMWGTVANGAYYYVAYNSSGALKLMKLTSVPGTPVAVGNINAVGTNDFNNSTNFHLNRIMAVGNYLYFSGINSSNYIKLYRMDLSTNVSTQVSNTYSASSDTPQYLTNYNGSLYFLSTRLNNETGSGSLNKTYKYDPSTNTVSQVTNNGRSYNVSTQLFTLTNDVFQYPMIFQNELYFYGNNEYNAGKLYRICEVGAGCSP